MSGAKPNLDGIVHAAFAHGLTIFVLVASLGHIRQEFNCFNNTFRSVGDTSTQL